MEGALLYFQLRVLSSLPHTVSFSRGCLLTPWVSKLLDLFCASPSSLEEIRLPFPFPFLKDSKPDGR